MLCVNVLMHTEVAGNGGRDGCRCLQLTASDIDTFTVGNETHVKFQGFDKVTDTVPLGYGSSCDAWDEKEGQIYSKNCTGDDKKDWCSKSWCYVDLCACGLSVPDVFIAMYLNLKSTSNITKLGYSYITCTYGKVPTTQMFCGPKNQLDCYSAYACDYECSPEKACKAHDKASFELKSQCKVGESNWKHTKCDELQAKNTTVSGSYSYKSLSSLSVKSIFAIFTPLICLHW